MAISIQNGSILAELDRLDKECFRLETMLIEMPSSDDRTSGILIALIECKNKARAIRSEIGNRIT